MHFSGNDIWKADPKSPCYDYKLIEHRLSLLREERRNKDVTAIIYLLRCGKKRKCDRESERMITERDFSVDVTKQKVFTGCNIETFDVVISFIKAVSWYLCRQKESAPRICTGSIQHDFNLVKFAS
jgi:hypothetical protein